VLLFLIGALRAVVEMLGLCFIGQGFLYLLVGRKRANNPVYQLLSLITRAPRKLCARLLPARSPSLLVAICTFLILGFFWIGLALLRKFH
jgi:hypothetical protein